MAEDSVGVRSGTTRDSGTTKNQPTKNQPTKNQAVKNQPTGSGADRNLTQVSH